MADVIVTGASRGIGRALALSLATGPDRLWLVARDGAALATLASEITQRGGVAEVVLGDLGTRASAAALGRELARRVGSGATLVHNAGLWPSRRERDGEGLERSFVVNHLAPLVMQAPLLDAGLLARVVVVSAGLIGLGRFDAEKTPTGEDFSALRTYATTKLAFAVAMRGLAAQHPEVEVVVLHPGVVRTDLGARSGPLGWLLSLVKRRWEAPEVCGARLARILGRPRGAPPGDAQWLVLEEEQPWPAPAADPVVRRSVAKVTAALLGNRHAG